MFIDPIIFIERHDIIENIEKASMRFVTCALLNFKDDAQAIFRDETDLAGDIGEDITREALDLIGISKCPVRFPGKTDYKKACYQFHKDYAVRQALFIDSKAEKAGSVARIQPSQVSMIIKQIRQEEYIEVSGTLQTIINTGGFNFITTTIFVKFFYDVINNINRLKLIKIACIPNGILQNLYNPTCEDTIWSSGPNAPSRGEAFRTRLNFGKLKQKCSWRVQDIPVQPEREFSWDD